MRKFLVAAAAASFACPAFAQQPPPPKLLVVISVDQFSADLFDEYRSQFTAGFARLASGVVFDKAYQAHANTETCPGHSTILTGDHPTRTGIIGKSGSISRSSGRKDRSIARKTRRYMAQAILITRFLQFNFGSQRSAS